MRRPHPKSTLFPYTTLFRSGFYHDAAQSRELGVERAPYAATVVVVHVDDPDAPGREGLPREPRQLRSVLHVAGTDPERSEEHTSELQSQFHLVCRLLLEKKN